MIVWVLGGIAALYFLRLGNAGLNLRYDIVGLSFEGFEGINPRLKISMRFVNATKQAILLNSIFLEVFSTTGNKIGEIASPDINRNIEPNAISTISFIFLVNSLTAGRELLNILRLGKLPTQLKFTGQIRANEILLPVDYNYITTTNKPATI